MTSPQQPDKKYMISKKIMTMPIKANTVPQMWLFPVCLNVQVTKNKYSKRTI
jgi:hypothetical protein